MKKIIGLILITLAFTSCYTNNKFKKYGACYMFWYTSVFNDVEQYYKRDSVTVIGQVMAPKKKFKDKAVSVIFSHDYLLPDVRGDTVYCDDKGKFSITLKRDGYDVFVSGSSMSIVFFIDKLGHLGDGVRLNIYPQREVRSKLFKDE